MMFCGHVEARQSDDSLGKIGSREGDIEHDTVLLKYSALYTTESTVNIVLAQKLK